MDNQTERDELRVAILSVERKTPDASASPHAQVPYVCRIVMHGKLGRIEFAVEHSAASVEAVIKHVKTQLPEFGKQLIAAFDGGQIKL